MALNALAIDPQRPWKGVWRWWSDATLSCLSPLEELHGRGITFGAFARLATCNGLDVVAKRGDRFTYADFLADLKEVCSGSGDVQMVVSFSRKHLGQTGDGHFSPVAALYEPADGSEPYALVLDVARFKYPAYFAPARLLFEAMKQIDRETGLSRGWYLLRKAKGNQTLSQASAPGTPVPMRKSSMSVCKLGESMATANEELNIDLTSAPSLGVKRAGLDTLISQVIPDAFRQLYPPVNHLSAAEQREAMEFTTSPTLRSVIDLAVTTVVSHVSDLPASIMDMFLPRTTPLIDATVRQHPLFKDVSSLVFEAGSDFGVESERFALLLLALPPACFKPLILSAFPNMYELVESARSTEGWPVLRAAVENWRLEWEAKTQQTCD
ncbi:Phytochelatin synthase-domain-containing protein, partial [Hyaloraphidium curvatum]